MCVCGEFEFTHSCHALGASREPRLAPSRARLISQTRGARLPFRGVEAPKTHCLRKEAAAHTATQLMAPCKHWRCPSLALPTSPLPRQPIKACCAYLLGMFFFLGICALTRLNCQCGKVSARLSLHQLTFSFQPHSLSSHPTQPFLL